MRARNYNPSEEKKARGDNYASNIFLWSISWDVDTQIDYIPLGWAIHKLSGIATLINASSTVDELAYQLRASKSSVLFTCIPLLATALEAASKCGIPRSRVYILEMPQELLNSFSTPAEFTTMSRLIEKGSKLCDLDALKWQKGQGASQCAYLCFSSGTSGLPACHKLPQEMIHFPLRHVQYLYGTLLTCSSRKEYWFRIGIWFQRYFY